MDDIAEKVLGSRRPVPALLAYYALRSLILGPLFPLLLVPGYLRYRSMRYRFDDEGVTMRWGVLFHREISLNYGRIQDIHLASNLVERRLGLARVQVQTAAGSATAEMTLEGLPNAREVRDYFYLRMRGARKGKPRGAAGAGAPDAEVVHALREAAAELRALREALAERDAERRR